MAALRRALDPENAGRVLEDGEHILPEASLAAAPGEAFALLSRAVDARPQRWTGADSTGPAMRRLPPPTSPREEDPWETTRYPEEATASGMRSRRNTALGRMVAALERRVPSAQTDEFEVVARDEADEYSTNAAERVKERVQARATTLLIEVWIFLQFVIVLVAFVWIMARKGPHAVIGAPSRRQTT